MAGRPPKEGLDYFPLEVGFFSDDKIEMLEGEHGPLGSYVYVRLLCLIYKDNGYFYHWTESERVLLAKRIGNGITPQKVELIVRSCIKWSLFDRTLFDTYAVLTSKGIQRRYILANKERARKAAAEGRHTCVDEKLWLVDEETTERSFIKVGLFANNSGNNTNYSVEIFDNSAEEFPKENKKKENKKKRNKSEEDCADRAESKPVRHKYGAYNNVMLSDEDVAKLKSEFPMDWEERIERLSEYIASKGNKYKNHLATIRSWARKEKPTNGIRGQDPDDPFRNIGYFV